MSFYTSGVSTWDDDEEFDADAYTALHEAQFAAAANNVSNACNDLVTTLPTSFPYGSASIDHHDEDKGESDIETDEEHEYNFEANLTQDSSAEISDSVEETGSLVALGNGGYEHPPLRPSTPIPDSNHAILPEADKHYTQETAGEGQAVAPQNQTTTDYDYDDEQPPPRSSTPTPDSGHPMIPGGHASILQEDENETDAETMQYVQYNEYQTFLQQYQEAQYQEYLQQYHDASTPFEKEQIYLVWRYGFRPSRAHRQMWDRDMGVSKPAYPELSWITSSELIKERRVNYQSHWQQLKAQYQLEPGQIWYAASPLRNEVTFEDDNVELNHFAEASENYGPGFIVSRTQSRCNMSSPQPRDSTDQDSQPKSLSEELHDSDTSYVEQNFRTLSEELDDCDTSFGSYSSPWEDEDSLVNEQDLGILTEQLEHCDVGSSSPPQEEELLVEEEEPESITEDVQDCQTSSDSSFLPPTHMSRKVYRSPTLLAQIREYDPEFDFSSPDTIGHISNYDADFEIDNESFDESSSPISSLMIRSDSSVDHGEDFVSDIVTGIAKSGSCNRRKIVFMAVDDDSDSSEEEKLTVELTNGSSSNRPTISLPVRRLLFTTSPMPEAMGYNSIQTGDELVAEEEKEVRQHTEKNSEEQENMAVEIEDLEEEADLEPDFNISKDDEHETRSTTPDSRKSYSFSETESHTTADTTRETKGHIEEKERRPHEKTVPAKVVIATAMGLGFARKAFGDVAQCVKADRMLCHRMQTQYRIHKAILNTSTQSNVLQALASGAAGGSFI